MSGPRFAERLADGAAGMAAWTAAILVIAGLTHVASILAMPRLAPRDAYARMESLAPPHRMTPLPDIDEAAGPSGAAAPLSIYGWTLPAMFPKPLLGANFEDPALARAVCRYDLTRGPLRLRATLPPEALTLISFHSRFGEVFYSMTDRSATRGRLDALLFLREQLDDVESNDSEDELPQELRIISPTPLGFVLARALAERPGERAEARGRAASISCGVDSDQTSKAAD